ncbi:MAG: 4Fe-4S binding protein [Euryarchaeota archaeon]|nr:4Fe-4S binding protein [Euryarchaeota archaeon]
MKGLKNIITESIRNLRDCQTISYPSSLGQKYSHLEGLRGKPEFDSSKCTGCQACVRRCSDNAISVVDENGVRTLTIDVTRCMYCGRCAEICPVGAITMTNKFELSYDASEKPLTVNEVAVNNCVGCGTPYDSTRLIKEVQERVIANVDPSVVNVVQEDLPKYIFLCPQCRRRVVYELKTHTRKYY